MKYLNIGMIGMLLACTPVMAEEVGRLPAEWFVLPEQEQSFKATDQDDSKKGLIYRRRLSAVERSIETMYKSTVTALDTSKTTIGALSPPADAPADWVPWHLKELIMDIGVSAQGTVGVLTSKGSLAAEIYWKRQAEKLKELGVTAPVKTVENALDKNVIVREGMTLDQITTTLNPVVQTVMATGRIEPQAEDRLRTELTKVATQLNDIMTGINSGNTTHWAIDSYRLDISISASGSVASGVSLGGSVRLRFEWKKSDAKFERVTPESEAQRDMRMLLLGIVNDLEMSSDEEVTATGFELKKLQLGIGGFLQAKFGVAKGKLAANGYVSLKKLATPVSQGPRVVPEFEIPLVYDHVDEEHLTYASQNNVPYTRHRDPDTGAEKVVYYLNRDRFQKGLQKAVNMGALFTGKAKAADGDEWYIYKVKPKFELSLMGVFGVVTVGGSVSLQMEFTRS